VALLIRVALVFLTAGLLLGEEHSGHVLSGKRPIPGATITAAQEQIKLVTSTDENGYYSFPDFKPGKWVFRAEMFGFTPVTKEVTIVLQPSLQDFELELAGVSLEAPATKSAAGFQVLDVKEQDDPNPEKIASQVDAAASAPAPAATGGADVNSAFLVSGSLSGGLQAASQQDFFDQADEGLTSATKPKKAAKGGTDLAGVSKRAKKAAKKAKRANQANGVASFGKTKQQSQIRGSLFYSLRNSEADARPLSLSGQTIPKAAYTQNRFGLAAGGPLDLPGIHSPQTFFFVNYTRVRGRAPYTNIDTVPTLAQRTGDFTQPTALGPTVLYDPISHLPLAGNVVPSFRFDKSAQALLPFIPTPNLPGSVLNYQYTTSTPANTDDFSTKLNRNLSDRDRMSLSFNLQASNSKQPQLYGFQDRQDAFAWQSEIGWTHNFTPRTINSIHYAFSRLRNNTLPYFANGPNVAAQAGILGTSSDPINFGPPNSNFTNFGNLSDASAVVNRRQTSTIRDAVTLVRSPHNLTVGGEFRRQQINPITDALGRGQFIFTGLLTSQFDDNGIPQPKTGFDFADFLFGFPNSARLRYGTSANYFRASAFSLYATDDWKLRPNLTFNYGLRWEYFQPYVEKYDRMSTLDLAPGITGAAPVLAGKSGPYSGAFPRALVDSDLKNFSPRVALAWRPFEKTHLVMRGGYSIFYNGAIYGELPGRQASQPPFAQITALNASINFPLRVATGFTFGNFKTINNSFVIDRGYRDGYAQTWNYSVEQTIRKSWVVELSYVGTKGTRLDVQSLPNRAKPGSPLTAEDRRLIGNAVGFTYETSNGNSILHAGQVRVTRRLHKGLSLNTLYTFSKSIDDASTTTGANPVLVQDYTNLAAERSLSSFDQRHNLNVGFTAESPLARGRGGAVENLLAAWRLAGTITASSGVPYTARVLGNLSDATGSGNLGSSRPDATGLAVNSGSGFFNPTAFTFGPAGRFGNAGRNTIEGPSRFAANFSLLRSFHPTERYHIEFRIDASNLTNRAVITNFSTVLNSVNYGRASAALPMRAFRAGLRLKF
jgi:hypothetical protein